MATGVDGHCSTAAPLTPVSPTHLTAPIPPQSHTHTELFTHYPRPLLIHQHGAVLRNSHTGLVTRVPDPVVEKGERMRWECVLK